MTRILRWTLLLAVAVAFNAGCSGDRKDVIPTKIEDKPLGPPKPLGGKEPVKGKGGEAQ
jgi:hypothetical protein